MRDDLVEVQERYYRQPDGRVRQEVWCGGQMLYESIAFNFWYNVMRPRVWMPWQDPRSAISVIDGSCLVTALVKEGPKAIVKIS